jgi:deoxyribonuclease-1
MLRASLIAGVAILMLGTSLTAHAEPPVSFEDGKDQAETLWWDIGPKSFYCGCDYRAATAEEKELRPGNLWVGGADCPYSPRNPLTRSGKRNARIDRIEWEHVVPAEWIATGFGCQEDTRAACRKIDGFKEAEGDLFNLVPAIGEINGDRSSLLYGQDDEEKRAYGQCDFEIISVRGSSGKVLKQAEPDETIRGDLARIWFYMEQRYGVQISLENRETLIHWNIQDPVDVAECTRSRIIADEMGWNNLFVHCPQ